MKRLIEKFAHERKKKEEDFSRKLKELRKKSEFNLNTKSPPHIQQLFAEFESILKSKEDIPSKKHRPLSSLSRRLKTDFSQEAFNREVLLALQETQNTLDQNIAQVKTLLSSFADLSELNASLAHARDREWDVLGSNHVGIIFKSMEWRINQLSAQHKDVSILLKKFLLLKEKLTQLLNTLEEKRTPSSAQVKEILQPLEDWRYMGFENRFRGSEEEVKKQQAGYVPYFKKGGKVLDLGCGRGEFLELLEENGMEAVGVDINEEMADVCQEKGLNCHRGDLLKKLAGFEDGSFSGVFSSQVIEHLPPVYLTRLVELAYFKLTGSGSIVLETINPTSVFSLVQIYFLDYTHQKPIHPQMLKFLLENAGFEDAEIKYSSPLEGESLQSLPGDNETTSILNRNIDNLNKLLYAAPNYAAIAKKP